MKILKNVLLILVVFVVSYWTSDYFGVLYGSLFAGAGSLLKMNALIGLPLAYIFFLVLLFYVFCKEEKIRRWWIGIGLIPAVIFELYFDLSHIYFPIILGIIGWAIGFGIQALIGKLKVSKLGS